MYKKCTEKHLANAQYSTLGYILSCVFLCEKKIPVKIKYNQISIRLVLLASFLLINLFFPSNQLYAQVCGTSGIDGPTTNISPINTYFPISGNKTLLVGQNSILVDAVPPNDPVYNNSYGLIPILPGDLILIIQMQDAEIAYSNNNLYGQGSGTSGNDGLGGTGYTDLGFSGKFEYVIATNTVPLTGGTLTFRGGGPAKGVVNSYFNADATATRGQRRFQIVRVPQFSNLTLNADITTAPYNGKAGGIIAFDVAGNMSFNGFRIDASGRGFRGGYGPNQDLVNPGLNKADIYVIPSSDVRSVGKGEGIAGTPKYMWDGFNQVPNVSEGLPGGSYGKGAPANGGGGGNDHNAGGGGGGNAGYGGDGGRGWEGAGGTYPNGGRPGSAIPQDLTRLIMGGGGGGGDANNALSGVNGGVGGGIILVNVEKITGTGLIRANGSNGQPGVYGSAPDGAGGGGAGGAIFLRTLTNSAGASLTLEAKGGNGGNTLNDNNNAHGPGGGGGGGFIYHDVPGATINTNVQFGVSGKSNNGAGINHEAEDGTSGVVKSFTTIDLPTYLQGGGSICYPRLTTVVAEAIPGVPGSRNPGTTASYTITVTNDIAGGNAGDVKTDFQLPAGFSFVSVSATLIGSTWGPTNPVITQNGNIVTFGSYNISPGDQVIFNVIANIAGNVAPGMYHASAESSYLDPTRTLANPNRRVTGKTNAFLGSNTSYETGTAGDVAGNNYDGNLAGSTTEDVHINAQPVPINQTIPVIECEPQISSTLTATDPDPHHPANTLTYSLEGTYDTSKGTFTLQPNGVFTFTPAVKLFGTIDIDFRVTDPLGAYRVGRLRITQPLALIDAVETITNVTCNGGNNGSISVISTGGVGAHSYSWTGPNSFFSTNKNITNLVAGTYQLTVTDQNNCKNIEQYVVAQPAVLAVTPSSTQILCNGGTSTVTLTATGGTAPYTYIFNGVTNYTGVFNNVSAGANYVWSVNDANNCGPVTGNLTIVEPTATVSSGNSSQIVCINNAITNITFNLTGVTTTVNVTGLPAGVTGSYNAGVFTISGTPTIAGTFNYSLTIAGCATSIFNGIITVNPNVTLTLTSPASTTSQTICINSPIINITYAVGNGATGAFSSPLPAGLKGDYLNNVFTISGTPTEFGTFPYTVATAGGCSSASLSGTITINASPTLANAGPDRDLCYTTTITLDGNDPVVGTGSWSVIGGGGAVITNPNQYNTTVTGLGAGTYNFVWTTNNGVCTPSPDLVTITIRNQIANNVISADQTILAHQTPATLTGTIPTGGLGLSTYTYQWESSTTSATTGFSPIAGATSATYSPGLLTQTTYFRRIVTYGTCGNLISNAVIITVNPSADIVTVKNTSQSTYVPGGTVTYTIVVKNNGPSDATNVNVLDNAPTGTTIQSWAAIGSNGVTPPNANGTGDLNETIAVFPNGGQIIYTIVVKTPSNFTVKLSNSVVVTSPTPDPNPCTACTTPDIDPKRSADIVTVKTTSQLEYVPGGTVTYLINIRNNGPSDAKDVNIKDTAPAGTTIQSWSATGNGGIVLPNASGTGDLNETIPVFPNGAEAIYVIVVKIPSNFTQVLRNTVIVDSPTPDPNPCITCSATPVNPNPSADLVTVKKTTQLEYVPGQTVTYTIVVKNNGPSDAKDVNVKDTAPARTTIQSWTAVGSNGVTPPNTSGTGNLNETIPVFPNGGQVIYTVVVKIPSDFTDPLSNSVTAKSQTTPDPNPDPNCADCTTDEIDPNPSADIVTVKKTLQDYYVPGSTVTYTINVKNNGPSDAANVNVIDNAPVGTTIQSWTATGNRVNLRYTSGTGNLNETIPVFPNGAEAVYTIVVSVPLNFTGDLINSATAKSQTTPDPNPDPNCADCTTTTPTEPNANLVTAKTLKDPTQTTYIPGQDVVYLITINNYGPGNARAVHVVDNAPTGTSISSWKASVISGTVALPHTSGTGNIDETIALFPNNATVVYEVAVKTPPDFTATFKNLARVTSPTPNPVPDIIKNPDPSCPTCIPSDPVTAVINIDLSMLKKAEAKALSLGYEFGYEFAVTNNSYFIAHDVVVKDKLPDQVSYVENSATHPINYEPSTKMITWNIGDLPKWETKTVKFKVKVDVLGNIINTATVSGAEPDPVMANNISTAVKNAAVLKVPNVITPNGDGKNDEFKVAGLDLFPENSLSIFNRWGNEVYRSKTGYKNDWTGEGLSEGTYYYVLKLKLADGSTQSSTGYITLLRDK